MASTIEAGETIFRGIGVSPGVTQGKVLVLEKGQEERPRRRPIPAKQVESELNRLEAALTKTRGELRTIRDSVRARLGASDAQIFDAHLLVLDDPVLIDQVTQMIRDESINAEYAFYTFIGEYTQALSEVQDDYLRERVADIRDVADRVLGHLTGRDHAIDLEHLEDPCIIISHELTPGHTAQLDRAKVLGFATDVGGKTSHTAIMAGSLRIPAVVGLRNASREITTGAHALLDGLNGLIIVNPTDQTLFEYGQLTRKREDLQTRLAEIKDSPAITLDGQHITLSANVEQISDTAAVLDCGAEGVGLFRTEYLFLDRDTAPTEEEQYLSYQKVATAVAPQTVIFRTLDIGADKLAGAWTGTSETNPFLGWRAIRFCLQETAIFKAQLRAILRASTEGNVKVMYPMISSVDELTEANKLLEECQAELTAEGLSFDKNIEAGVMIEIPSAVMIADALAQRAKFFSLGTNDLIQYTLAVDRLNERVAHMYDPTHPAMLKLIRLSVEAGKKHGIWTGICGEMAGDPALVPLLIGLGVDELSVAPPMLPQIKHLIRHLKTTEAQELARSALEAEASVDILVRSRALVQRVAPGLLESQMASL
ncbi:MAG: phosphoenolpyruvate--protein phosphotransferase [Verrucomicrobiales bacterium]|nr:phosphoenolpyruvate--protein phosphotransferase [Verrucomicrobiales bacterium]